MDSIEAGQEYVGIASRYIGAPSPLDKSLDAQMWAYFGSYRLKIDAVNHETFDYTSESYQGTRTRIGAKVKDLRDELEKGFLMQIPHKGRPYKNTLS